MKPITHKRTTRTLFERSSELRRNPTPAEARLWARLCSHRQHHIWGTDSGLTRRPAGASTC